MKDLFFWIAFFIVLQYFRSDNILYLVGVNVTFILAFILENRGKKFIVVHLILIIFILLSKNFIELNFSIVEKLIYAIACIEYIYLKAQDWKSRKRIK